MESISKSITKKDHEIKITGNAQYVDDHEMTEMLLGKLFRSDKAKAKILYVHLPEIPKGYFIVDKNDVPGVNKVAIIHTDTPVYADERVEFIGDPILMVVGPDMAIIDDIMKNIVVHYEVEEPVLDMRKSKTVFFNYHYEKGDIDGAMADADWIFTETFQTGYQEQAYIEPQGMIAYAHDGRMTVRGSLQCPYYIHGAVMKALGYGKDDVQIIQDVTGGGFGGKEAYPSILACQVAVAAFKSGKPVKVIFDRREDMAFTSKRHPSISTYKVAVKDGKVTGMDIDVLFNGGAYTTLSAVVLQRGLICASGVYDIEHLSVVGKAVKTNSVPCGAYRGFGAPQTFFAVESIMNHIARKLGVDPLQYKESHLVKQGDITSTNGKYHFHVPLPEMIARAKELSDFEAKREQFKKETGRYKKGIGISLFFHGCGFTGTGERDVIKAVTKLRKNADDTVEILASNTDIGQGLKTTFSKVVADTLEIPISQVLIENPDTDRVPDSGPTVASRSLMTVGGLLKKAAERLKGEWKSGEVQVVEERFKEPDFVIPFDGEAFQGDAYPTYSWGVNVVEVEVDSLTAFSKITGAWGVFDVGVPIDMNIIQGQMQGGMLQGLGYGAMEKMDYNDKGIIRNNSFSDYIIPTAVDIPNLVTEMISNPYTHGPYGAKGAGELPLVGAAPAYNEALEDALGTYLDTIPFLPEDIMKVLEEGPRS